MLDSNGWVEILKNSAEFFVFRHDKGPVAIENPLNEEGLKCVFVEALNIPVRCFSVSVVRRV